MTNLMDSGSAPRPAEAALEEVKMISQSCDFDEFLESVRDRDYLQVIYLADKEATEAERFKYRSRTSVVRHKSLSFVCHSGLDPESSVYKGIHAFTGMKPSEFM